MSIFWCRSKNSSERNKKDEVFSSKIKTRILENNKLVLSAKEAKLLADEIKYMSDEAEDHLTPFQINLCSIDDTSKSITIEITPNKKEHVVETNVIIK